MMKWDEWKGINMPILAFLLSLVFFLYGGFSESIAGETGILVIDRFTSGVSKNGLPVGWALEKEPGPNSKISVEAEGGNHFLRLLSMKDTFGLKKEITFDIRKYPYLSWRWKVGRLPRGGDIRKRNTDDESGQLYILFPKFPTTVNTRSVGYIWDSTAPKGYSGTSTAYGKMKYFILQSGSSGASQWVTETRNVYEDYKKLFREEPPSVGGLLIYINSQHTASSAECDYADIYFSATPPKTQEK